MGSDGLYDKQSNSDIIKSIYKKAVELYNTETQNLNTIALLWSESIVKEAIDNKALDNISWNIIIFDNFLSFLKGRPITTQGSAFDTVMPKSKHESPITGTLSSSTNHDLTDADIDRTHSSKAIEYLLQNL